MKKIILFLIVILILVGGFFTYIFFKNKEYNMKSLTRKESSLLETIMYKYGEDIITNRESDLYKKVDGKYKKVGKVGKNIKLSLGKINITKDTKYFPITSLKDEYFISYKDVSKTTKDKEKTKRYKHYIPFDINVKSEKDSITLYQNDEAIYTLPEKIDTPLIIRDGDKYYIEYNDDLYYVKKDEVSLYDHENSNAPKAGSISTVLYHFIYDPNKGESCDQIICQKYSEVENQLNWLNQEGYFALNMEEFDMWIDGKVNMPYKSVVLTIDDGQYNDNVQKLFNEKKVVANFFIVTSWFDPHYYRSEYVTTNSHTHNMHNPYECNGVRSYIGSSSQGGGLLCKSDMLDDLKKSRELTFNSIAISYPFYDYNDKSIEAVKSAGYKLGFAGYGAGGHRNMEIGKDKYKIPRYTFTGSLSIEGIRSILVSNYSI